MENKLFYSRMALPLALGLLGLGLDSDRLAAQTYPIRPIRIVTSGTGGAGDFTARLLAQGLAGSWSQPVVVDNRGGGILAAEIVSKAAPDGYTLLVYGASFWIGPLLQENTPYDPVNDFAPVSLIDRAPNVLVVYPSLPVKSVKELIVYAKARPGELNYSSSATGSAPHIAAELFKAMAGVNIVRVPYKGGGATVNAVIGGEVQVSFTSAAAATPHVKSGRLRALAVTSAESTALAPGLPTVASTGLRGYESVTTTGIFGPAKMPAMLIDRLNQEIVRNMNKAGVKEKFFHAGSEVVTTSPAVLRATVRSDMAKMGKLIKDAGIHRE